MNRDKVMDKSSDDKELSDSYDSMAFMYALRDILDHSELIFVSKYSYIKKAKRDDVIKIHSPRFKVIST